MSNKVSLIFLLSSILGLAIAEPLIANAFAEGDQDGICVHYFQNGYMKAGEKCLEDQKKQKEKEKCERSGSRDCDRNLYIPHSI